MYDAIQNFKYACSQLREANTKYKIITKNSKSLREEFLKKLADEIALEQGTDAGNELKKLIHIEQQRNQAESTRRILKPNHIGGLTSILIPSATEYENRESDNFNVYDINQMWKKIMGMI